MHELVADLVAEQDVVDRAIAGLSRDRWDAPSPAAGWTLRDCVAHLAEFDALAAWVVTRGELPPREPRRGDDERGVGLHSSAQLRARSLATADLLTEWRDARARLANALAPLAPRARLPWFGPPMSSRSFATARLMEAWSHGLDILESAGVAPVDSDRLHHIAHLGYVTREFAYRNRALVPPETPLFVELQAPSGAVWRWGPDDATDRISGPAGDFCRVVTQRLHPADTTLRAEGEHAAQFLRIAQAFAGPPGPGRPAKSQTPSD